MSLLTVMLKDDVLFQTLRDLGNRAAVEARFDTAVPHDLETIEGFEDVAWLFSQNELNHGLARLRTTEAAYLWKLARSLPRPRIAEIGRFKGGTALMLAAAGGTVLTIDNDPARQEDALELGRVLTRFGLRDSVDIVQADGLVYPVAETSFDLVILDALWSYDGARQLFLHWWPGVTVGGHLMLRNVMEGDPTADEVRRLASELDTRDDACRVATIGQWAHYRRLTPPTEAPR